MSRYPYHVKGDEGPGVIEFRREHTGDPGRYGPDSLDAVVCVDVLHDLPGCEAAIALFARWLRDGGVVYAEEPNGGSIANRLTRAGRAAARMVMARTGRDRSVSPGAGLEHDYTMAEYLDMFGRQGFTCVRLKSVRGRRGMPPWKGFTVETALSTVEWVIDLVAGRLNCEPLNRGRRLVFAMKVVKMRDGME